ncbi:flippase [Polaribacter sp. KT 15]|uniref:flippase n=1 Tax=Polaribacter sp. KT 15 TaxID=1896175 RepID=UPI00090C9043|nr:flippase [Polaribacter sp. KT 15]SHM86865.1 Membrane protein involved in the export of O-antigen and teichoic acid [Polaribacter sp. KT 15]
MLFKSLVNRFIKIRENENFIKYFSNTLWLFISKFLGFFSAIFITAWVARYLGPETYGLLAYSNSLVALFLPIAMIGLNDIIVKELVKAKDKIEISKILGTAFLTKLFFGLVSLIFLVSFVFLNKEFLEVRLLILIFSSFLIFQSLEVFDFYFQSQVKSKFVVYSRIIAVVISSIIKVVLINVNAPVQYFAIVIVLEFLITHLCTFIYFNENKIKISILNFDKNYALSLLKRSWPLFLSGMMYIVYVKIDQIMVKEILGANAAGLYAVSISLSEVWYFIPNIIAASFFPAILFYKSKDQKIYHKRITNLYSLLFWLAVFISLFITFFGEWIIEVLYGSSFYNSYKILSIYIWSNIFFFFTTISSKWLVAEGFYLHSFYRNIIGAFLNVILNIVLINEFGLVGAAVSTLISYAFVGVFYDLFFKELRVNFKLKLKSILFIN